jgi:hypothetical protein
MFLLVVIIVSKIRLLHAPSGGYLLYLEGTYFIWWVHAPFGGYLFWLVASHLRYLEVTLL